MQKQPNPEVNLNYAPQKHLCLQEEKGSESSALPKIPNTRSVSLTLPSLSETWQHLYCFQSPDAPFSGHGKAKNVIDVSYIAYVVKGVLCEEISYMHKPVKTQVIL